MHDIHRSATRHGAPLLLAALCTLLPTLAQAAWPFAPPAPQTRQAPAPTFPWAAPAQPAARAPASPFPWAAAPQPARPAQRPQAAPGFPFPWGGSAQAARPAMPGSPFGFMSGGGNPFGAPSPGFFGAPGGMPFGGGMGGMMGPMTGPMAQGMAGIMAPMMANYAIASMNPTTMNSFMGLMMQNPTGFGGGYGGGFPFGARQQPAFPFGMMGR